MLCQVREPVKNLGGGSGRGGGGGSVRASDLTLPEIIATEFIDLTEIRIDAMKCDELRSKLKSRCLK